MFKPGDIVRISGERQKGSLEGKVGLVIKKFSGLFPIEHEWGRDYNSWWLVLVGEEIEAVLEKEMKVVKE